MTESIYASKNLIGGFRPHEGRGVLVGVGNVGPDNRLERLRTAMHLTPRLFLRPQRETNVNVVGS